MQSLLKRDVNAMELLEWALSMGDEHETSVRIAEATVPIGIRRKALELLEASHTSVCFTPVDIPQRRHE
ncbi:MAG: hypothetical protein AAGK17_12285 [Pseudomonadota bacterium]